MRGASDRVFRNAGLRGEEARDKVIGACLISRARDDDTARWDAAQSVEIGRHPSHRCFVLDFDEVIEAAAPDECCFGADRLDEPRWRRGSGRRCGGEVELDPGITPIGRQKAALRMKARLLVGLETTVLPEHVRTGERRMAAEIDLDGGSEPAEIVAIALRNQ